MRLNTASQFGAFGLNAAAANSVLAAQQAALVGAPADYSALQGFVGFNNATGLAAAAAAAGGGAPAGMELGGQV
jgi:hypothetical protein